MEEAILILRLILAGVFVTSATAKLVDFEGAKKAMNEFGMPVGVCAVTTFLLIVLEYCVAFLFIPVESSRLAAIISIVLLLVFSVAMLRLLFLGKSTDCRCFGQLQSRPVDTGSIVRNIVLVSLAAALVLIPETGLDFVGYQSAGASNIVLAFFGFAGWSMLTAAVILGLESRKSYEIIEERLETLEATAAFLDKRDTAGDPQEGMPVGSIPGEATLLDIDSNPIPMSALWSEGRPLFAILASPRCIPCESLAGKFAEWGSELAEKINLVIISSGDVEENIGKFGQANKSRLYFQEQDQASEALGSKWTPTGVLVASDGRIASRPAAGDNEIEKLMGYIRESPIDSSGPLFVGEPDDLPAKTFGDEIPDFELQTITGTRFTKNDLMGRNTVAVFWSLTCTHCTEMLGQLHSWRNNGSEISLVVFADGDEAKLRETGLEETLVLDEGFKVSEKIGMLGTPSAILIDAGGRVISELVAGADRIRKLSGFK